MAENPRVKDVKNSGRVQPGDIYNYLTKDKGLSHNHALGMLANINTESAGFQHSVVGDNGNAIGLFQHNGPRKAELLKYVNGNTSDWKKQIDFALLEKDSKNYLSKVFSTPEAATENFMLNWERPKDKSKEAIAGRIKYLSEFGNGVYATPGYQVSGGSEDASSFEYDYNSNPLITDVEHFNVVNSQDYSVKAASFKEDLAIEKEKAKKVETEPETQELTAAQKEYNNRISFLNTFNQTETEVPKQVVVDETQSSPINPDLYAANTNIEIADQTTPLFSTTLNLPETTQEFADGGTVSELWEQKMGTPWSEASKSGRTDGSLEANLRLKQQLLSTNSVPSAATVDNNQAITTAPKTFNEAFKVARQTLGANNIFEYNGRKFGTNMPGELFNPSQDVLEKSGLNTPKVKSRLEKQNELLDSPYTTKSTVKLQPDEYMPWDKVKLRTEELNKKTNADLIVEWNKKNRPDKNYAIIDKKKGLLHIYSPEGKLLTSSAVDTGKSKGDAQTVTKYKDLNKDGKITDADKVSGKPKVDWTAGNMTTGAGKFYISNIDKTGYEGLPILNMMNEGQYDQYKKTGKVEQVSTSFHKGYIKDDDSRVSNGCIRCNKSTLDNLSNMLKNTSQVYILPDDDGNSFVVENGKLNFKAKSKVDYNNYKDSQGKPQKGQGINSTQKTLNHIPIKVKLDTQKFRNDKFTTFDINDEKELENVKKYTKALQDSKQQIMKVAKINGDVYNEIAKISFGIFGTESNYADTHSFEGNALRAVGKLLNPSGSSSPDYASKYYLYGAKDKNRSVGLTQVRWKYLNADERSALRKLGITTNADFLDPKKAAIGTTAILAIRYNQQLNEKDKKDIWTNLPKKWNVRGNYADRVKQNSKYVQVYQKNKEFRDGGTFTDEPQTEFEDGGRKQSLADLTLGDEYHYQGRPNKSYKLNDNGEWLIKNANDKGGWKLIVDPTGERAATLERSVIPKAEYINRREEALQGELGVIKGQGNTFRLDDNRTIRATTGKTINPNVDLMHGEYSEDVVKEIIKRAREKGVDPKTALAIALQESHLGKLDSNLGHSDIGDVDPYGYMDILKSKVALAKSKGHTNEEMQLQFYNGTGKLFPGTEAKYHGFQAGKFYGVPVTSSGLDLMKNPLYGKQVIDLRDNVISKSPHIDSLLKVKNFGEGGTFIDDYMAEFKDGGTQGDGLYAHSGHNYKKIDGKWYMEPNKNSGNYKLIEQGDVKSRINELEKNAQVRSEELDRQVAWKEFGRDFPIQKPKTPTNREEAELMIASGELYHESISEIAAREKREAEYRKNQRIKSLTDYEKRYNNPNYNQFTGLPGESYRDNLAKEAESLDAKFRVSQEDNFFDDYINPAVWIGSMAKALGEAPKKAKETDSYMPYVTSIGAPLLGGAMGGLGASSTKQFVNNLVNPFAVTEDILNNISSKVGNRIVQGAKNINKSRFLPDPTFIPEQTFKKEIVSTYNPKTQLYDVHEIDVPQEVIPGRSYADVQHKMKNLREDLGINPIEHFVKKKAGSNTGIGLEKDAGMVIDPETGQLFDSNTRYWLNREYGIIPKPNINKTQLAKSNGRLINEGLSYEEAQKLLNNEPIENPFTNINSVNNAGKSLTFTEKLNPIFDHIYGVTEAIFDPFRYALTSSQKNKLVAGQDDVFEKALNFTEEWNFNPDGTINNSVKQRMKDLTEDVRTKEALDSYNRYDNSIYNPMTKPNKLVSSRRKDLELSDITDKDKTYITKNRTDINGVNTSDASITLRNSGNYYKKPENVAGIVVHEQAHSTQALGQKHSDEDGWSKPWSEGITKFDKNYGYFTSNKETEVGREFAKYMVEPKLISPGSNYSYKTWKSSPDELHSDLMKARYKLVEELSKNQTKEFRDDLINRLRDNPTDADIDLLLKNDLHKFFKYSTSQKNRRKLIRMLPAIIPAVGVGVGANQQQYREGGVSGTMILDSLLDQNNINEFKQKYGL